MTAPGAGDTAATPDALRAEFDRREARIRAMDDLAAAIGEAGKLTTESARFRGRAARLRTELAEKLREAEGLSVQQLADRLGVSKATAQKLLERDKRAARRRGRT